MKGKSGLDASEFIPLRVSSAISGWVSRKCARGPLQCIEVVKECNLNIWYAGSWPSLGEGSTQVGEWRLGSSMTKAVK